MKRQKPILNSFPCKWKEATNKQAFTLVELIVVITILAILGTIGFISLQGFSSDARDSKRISELSEIRSGLQIYQARNSLLPTPSEQIVTVGSGSTDLIIQGYAGESVLNEIKMNGKPKDPLDDNKYYTYSVNASKTKFQLLALLENDNNLTSFNNLNIIPTTHASYLNRYPYTVGGGTVGILLNETTNTPLNELQSGTLDLSTDTNNYKVVFVNNNQALTLSGELLYNEIVNQTNNNGIAQNNEPESTPITCPTGYILVPNDGSFTTQDFCVMKYEAKNVGGVATSQATGTPWVSITQPNAITACNALGTGYHLITNNEWMTIARNIEQQNDNWSNGMTGSGYIYSGHNDNSPANSLSASTNDIDGYNQTGNTTGNQKRTLTLSNGEVIWDLAGNVREHVNGTNNLSSTTGEVTNGQACSTTVSNWYAFTDGETSPPAGGTCLFNANTFYSKANHGPLGDYNANNGVGRIYSRYDLNNRIFLRGGAWHNTTFAGVFTLNLDNDSTYSTTALGFRCAFSVN